LKFVCVKLAMKKIMSIHKLFLPLLVVLVGCTFENQPLVTIDGDRYTVADFRQNFKLMPEEDSVKRMEKIDAFIDQMLVVKEARERGYEDDQVVKAAFETHRKDIISRTYYEENVVNKIKIPDSEVRKVYAQFIDQYHLAQIVVDNDSLAQYIQGELQKGMQFDSLLKFSLDTLTEGGDIGSFSVMSLPEEILTAIKKTKEGEVTDAIKFGAYTYFLKVIEHKKSDTPKFDEVKENIRNNLMRERITEAGEKFVAELLEDATVEFNQEGLDVFLKPDSEITEEDLDKWVVKKHDTSYVYVRTVKESVLNQFRRSNLDPKALIERVLVPDLIYDQALERHFDKNATVKRKLKNTRDLLVYQKFYSDEVLEKAAPDSLEVVEYYKEHKDAYKDKELSDIFAMLQNTIRTSRADTMREKLFKTLRDKYNPEINQTTVTTLLKEEK